jgi:hypothetical protein
MAVQQQKNTELNFRVPQKGGEFVELLTMPVLLLRQTALGVLENLS